MHPLNDKRRKGRAMLAWVPHSLRVKLLVGAAFALAVLIGFALPTHGISAVF